MHKSRLHVITLATLAGSAASVASAQTSWLAPNNGTWSTAANWTNSAPNTGVDATLGHTTAYTVSSALGVRDLNIANSLAQLTVASGTSFNVTGNISNNGIVTVNPSGGLSNANLSINGATVSLTGSGMIVLHGVDSYQDAQFFGSPITNVLTQGPGHTITGNGRVAVGLVNNGLISADGVGNYLQLTESNKANSSLVIAQNGGMIDIDGVTVTQSGVGTIRATGAGSIAEAHGSIIGGVLEGVNGGIARSGGILTLDGVDLNGTFQVRSNETVNVLNSLTNTGTIVVNPSGGLNNANLSINSASLTLDGGGTIVLNGQDSHLDAQLFGSPVANVLTQSAGHMITGNGRVAVGLINHGLIVADGIGKYLQLDQSAKTNNSSMVAQNGGMIDIDGIVLTQTGTGVYRATGAGSVAEAHGSIIGGTVEGVSGGVVRSGGALTLDGVDLNGAFQVRSGETVSVLTSLTNTGTVTVNPSGGLSDANISINSPSLTLDGGGTIVMNGADSYLDAQIFGSPNTNVLTHSAGHTITGSGRIAVNMINHGLLSANGAGKTLVLTATPKVNNALMVAQSGGLIDMDGIVLDQTGGGTYRATGVASIAEAHGTINGGVIEGLKGGVARSGGALTLNGVDINGTFQVRSGNDVSVQGSLTNAGTIIVNPTGGLADANMNIASPALTIDGPGEIVMHGVDSAADARVGFATASNVLTNATSHSIAGRGQITVALINQGIISPGHAVNSDLTQRIELSGATGDVTCASTSVVRIEIEGPAATQYDSIVGGTGTSFVCGGTLDVTHINGFTGPAINTIIDVIVAPSVTGTFATVNTPPLPNDGRYIVLYLPDRVRLIATCYANCDSSTGTPLLTANDFQCFLNQFAAADTYANCDHSTGTPALTANDFQCFLNRYAGGCF